MLKTALPKHTPCMQIMNDKQYKTRWNSIDIDISTVYEEIEVKGFYLLSVKSKEIIIVRLLVGPQFRAHGIGTLMLDAIKSLKKNLQITVNERDTQGIQWLTRKGFKGRGIVKGEFGTDDGILLRRSKNEQP